nr:ABC transporter permease [Acidipila sp. EB88]
MPLSGVADSLHAGPNSRTLLALYGREIRAELVKMLRNRAYSFSAVGFPVIFYLLFSSINRHPGPEGRETARYLLASYSCFGAVGAALFGIGNGLAYERGHGWLELKRASPMPPMAYLVAKLASSLVFSLTICLLLVALGPLVSGRMLASPGEIVDLLGVVAVGTIPFASLGLLFGLAVPPGSGPGLVNLLYLPLSFCGGLWVPVELLPKWMQSFAQYLPTFWFSRLALHVFGFTGYSMLVGYGVLATYTVVLLGISARVWRVSEARA